MSENHSNREPKDPQDDLEFQFDSGSFAPGKLSEALGLVYGPLGLSHMVDEINVMRDEILKPAGIIPVVSFLPSVVLSLSDVATIFEDEGIRVGSIDTPYLIPPEDFIGNCFENGHFIGVGRLKDHVGFTLLNTVSESQWRRRVADGIQTGTKFAGRNRVVLRTSSDFWSTNGQLGDDLIQLIKSHGDTNTNYAMAVEISAYETPTLNHYYETIQNLRNAYRGTNIEFFVSYDPAHIAQMLAWEEVDIEQRSVTHVTLDGQAVQVELSRYLDRVSEPNIVASIELNQFDRQGATHLPLNEGVMDFGPLLAVLGSHRRSNNLTGGVPAIVEHNPRDFRRILQAKTEFIVLLQDLKGAYDQARYPGK